MGLKWPFYGVLWLFNGFSMFMGITVDTMPNSLLYNDLRDCQGAMSSLPFFMSGNNSEKRIEEEGGGRTTEMLLITGKED